MSTPSMRPWLRDPGAATGEDGELAAARAALAAKIAAHAPGTGAHASAIPGLWLYRRTAPSACHCGVYEPSLNVFVQGRKRVTLGGVVYLCDGRHFLLTALQVPITSQILAASESVPLLSLLLQLDLAVVREMLAREKLAAPPAAPRVPGIALGRNSPGLLNACSRLLDLLDAPGDISFLGPLIQREILYRLIQGPQGQRLRAIATAGDPSHRAAHAAAWLRAHYTQPLRVDQLAAVAGMGASTLHHHFRALTAMSPLQYQKRLRLQAARDRMLQDGLDAASAAFAVGYESASQFNREYRRAFGQPPRRDIQALRAAHANAAG
ncbi:MAG: AraC family transcriptional regulator [Terriglobales bacterium]